jgi:hypothetical protein
MTTSNEQQQHCQSSPFTTNHQKPWNRKAPNTSATATYKAFRSNRLATSKSAPKLAEYGKCWKQNNQLPTKRRLELKDNSRVLQGVNSSCSFWRPLKMLPLLVDKDKTKKTFEISMQWFSKVYKYMDLRAPKQLTKGIVQTLEKSCCCLLYTTPGALSCKLDLFKTRKSCKQTFHYRQRPLLPFTCPPWSKLE